MKIFSELGATTKETPFEVGESSDFVITMLPSGPHVSIAFGTKMNTISCSGFT